MRTTNAYKHFLSIDVWAILVRRTNVKKLGFVNTMFPCSFRLEKLADQVLISQSLPSSSKETGAEVAL